MNRAELITDDFNRLSAPAHTALVGLIDERDSLKAELAALRAQQVPMTPDSPEFTDSARAALLWVLWHHQGGSSPVGQPLRFALGMGQHEHMTNAQVQQAKNWNTFMCAKNCGIGAKP